MSIVMENDVSGGRNGALKLHCPFRSRVQIMRKNLHRIIRCSTPKDGVGRRERRGQFVVKEDRLTRNVMSERKQHDGKQRVIGLSLDRGRVACREECRK